MSTEVIRIDFKFRPPTDERYLVINFKTYLEATGARAIELARKIDKVARDYPSVKVMIAPSVVDILKVAEIVETIEVIAQHVDPIEPGAHTGSVPIRVLAEYGIAGSLVNHSERPVGFNELAEIVSLLRRYGMKSIVCTPSPEASRMATTIADFVAFEDPELIGTGISVSKAKPELVKRNIEAIRSGIAIPLVGAGISSADDVRASIALGAQGVLAASAIVKAKNVEAKVREFIEALIE